MSDSKDAKFKSLLQNAISPIDELDTIKPPKEYISLAVQVRRNSGGFDRPLSHQVIESQVIYQKQYIPIFYIL